jgi:8-oxo-dGTP pyrophosphatase MutT (NUDIX family)
MTEPTFPVPVVRLIVTDPNGRVLILRRDNTSHSRGGWCLPGGKVDYGETVFQAAAKELYEETSLKCRSILFLFFQDSLPTDPGAMHCINLYLRCSTEGALSLNEESSEYAWIGPEDLEGYHFVFRNELGLKRFWSDFGLPMETR